MGTGGERQAGRHSTTPYRHACANIGALAAPRTAAAGGSPRRPRGTLEGAQRAVHRRRPERLRPTTPRHCGSCAAALGTRRRSPARWSAQAAATTACKGPRARGVVRTPKRRSGRAMGAALTRPTSTASASARARACGVCRFSRRSARPSGAIWRRASSRESQPAVGASRAPLGVTRRARAEHHAGTPRTPEHHDGNTRSVSVLKSVPRPSPTLETPEVLTPPAEQKSAS